MKTAEEILNDKGSDYISVNACINAMHEFASQSRWISCDERLPELNVPVLVYMDYGKCDVCRLGYYRDDSESTTWIQDVRPQHSNGSVIAWQPLPSIPQPPKQ